MLWQPKYSNAFDGENSQRSPRLLLVGDREADPVLAQLGEHPCQGERREALELVNVDEEVATLCLGYVCAAVRRKPDRGDEQAAQQL